MEEQKWLEEWHAKRKEEKRAKLEQSEATKENNKNYHAEFMKQARLPNFLNAEFLNTGYDLYRFIRGAFRRCRENGTIGGFSFDDSARAP